MGFTGVNCLSLTLRVGFTHSTNQTIAQKPPTDWLMVHPPVILNMKMSLYNRKLLSQSTTDLNHQTFATILRSLSSSEYVLIS